MANRYWVGGSATWDATAGSKWSTTSGGAGGSAVPSASDDVFFDANSGAVTITTSGSRVCRSLTATGFTGTLAHNGALITIGDASGGALTLVSGMTLSGSGTWTFVSTSNNGGAGWTITTGGKSLTGPIIFNGVGGKWIFGDAFTTTGELRLTNGTLDFNNKNATLGQLSSSNSNTRTLTLGSGTITLNQSAASFATVVAMLTVTNLTFSGASSTVVVSAADSSSRTMNLGGKTWGTITYTVAASTGALILTGANTIGTLNIGSNRTLTLPSATTTTISSAAGWNVNGTAGNLVTVNASTAASAATLSVASGNVISDYLSLQDSTATGGATFYAGSHSTNVSGNTGWSFTDLNTNVNGSQATETDTANAGAILVSKSGSQVTETDTANTGAPQVRPAGTLATETDTANAGTATRSIAGSQAAETDTANAGAPNIRPAGSLASETDTANAGTATRAVPGSQAAETDTANAGTFLVIIGYGSYSGGYGGGSAIIYTGEQASETDTGFAGSYAIQLEGAHLVETVTAYAGSASVVVPGSLVSETDTANTGVLVVVCEITGSRADETDTATAGEALALTPAPAERIYVISAELRMIVIGPEGRVVHVPAEPHLYTVPASTRYLLSAR